LFSGDWAHVSNFVAICICGWSAGFSIKVFTSPDDQFWANSVIVEGAREVMLVDAQLTKPVLKKYCSKSKKLRSRCPLSTLPIEHADHFLGLEVLGRHTRSEDYREFCGSGPNQQGLSRENR